MPRIGPEPKPLWSQVPTEVRKATERALGAPVRRADRAWGGYAPSPTYRLKLDDGRRAFFKASSASSDNAFMKAAHAREERNYRELAALIGPWAPKLIDTLQVGDWSVMLLEDLGPKSAPPWTVSLARRVIHSVAEFHSTTVGLDLPDWLHRVSTLPMVQSALWRAESGGFERLAALAGPKTSEALGWLKAHGPRLDEAASAIEDPGIEQCLMHLDIRSDNLRWTRGRLFLFDWPHAGVGPPEYDAAAFAQSVESEGGPSSEQMMAWYAERHAVNRPVLDGAIASFAGFFANRSWEPEVPGLPRVRSFQKAQLRVSLKWAATRLGLPRPDWVDEIAVTNWRAPSFQKN